MSTYTDPTVRHDIVMLFDIIDGNPNGDPDAGNRPRVDPETGHGLVTDVSIKRKIRDTITVAAGEQPGYDIFVKAGPPLNNTLERSYHKTGLKLDQPKTKTRKATKETTDASPARAWLCENYFDIRLFGAVLSTGNTSALGQIRGPLQVSFGRSLDPVTPSEHTITRQVHTTEKDQKEKQGGTMGNKWTIPYGLYEATLSYSATRGLQTGVTERDLTLLYRCLENLFDHTSSAARASMATRKLVVFTHDDAFGKAPMHSLVDRVQITRQEGVELPRSFSDYTVSVDLTDLPSGVTIDELV